MKDEKEIKKESIVDLFPKTYEFGFTIIPNSVLSNTALSKELKVLYFLLLSFAWGKTTCYPSHSLIGTSLRIKRGAVYKGLVKLRNLGLISWKKRGPTLSNEYTFHELPQNFFSTMAFVYPSKRGVVSSRIHETDNIETLNTMAIMVPPSKAGRNWQAERENISKAMPIIQKYFKRYKKFVGQDHPLIKKEQHVKVAEEILAFLEEDPIEFDQWDCVIDSFFNSGITTDFNINHFANRKLLKVRYYAQCYRIK